MDVVITSENVLSLNTEQKIVEIEKQLKELEKKEKELKAALKDEMLKRGLVMIDTDKVNIQYVPSYTKEKFDGKRFKEEHPKLYDKYVSIGEVSDCVKVKVK